MQQRIEEYQLKIENAKQKSLSQINSLQTFLSQQLNGLTERIVDKIDKHNQQIQNNVEFYQSIQDSDPLKGYFGNMLQSQLAQQPDVLEVDEQQDQQGQNQQVNQISELGEQQTHQQKQLKEVYSILKKAINLFADQYSNSITSLNNNFIDFRQKNVEYQSDFCLSQDKQHANILISNQSNNNSGDGQFNNKLQNQQIDIQFLKKIDLTSESPSHLPNQYHFNHVKCFTILDDNRRAVLCTRNNLLLIDTQTQKVIKYTQLRGAIPTLPTCIQALYSYEYEFEDLGSGQLYQDSIHSQILFGQNNDVSNCLFAIKGNSQVNPSSMQNEDEQIQEINKNEQKQKRKRVRKQNLVAVGVGSLSQTIDICIYSLKTLSKIIRLPGHLRTICKVIQPPLDYETMFSISSDKKIFVWNLTHANPILIENTNHAQSVNEALILNENQLATFSLNGEVFLWDIEYTTEFPHKFKNIKKKMIIQRSCLSLYIGQVMMNSDRFFFSITSQGIEEQKYYLEMNDFSNRILVKQELPHKVIGLNILSVNLDVYAIVTYSSSNFFEVYKVDTLSIGQKKVNLYKSIKFPSLDVNISTVIETPRVQFIQTNDSSNKMLIAFALDQNISVYSISLV